VLDVLRLRARAMQAIRDFFQERDFVEVDTPSIVPSPGLDVHLSAFEVRDPNGKVVGWLATSPEYQMKRLLCDGAERIFQLCKSHRAEEHGAHHEREFTMLEWYRTNAGSDEVIRDTEALVARVAEALGGDLLDAVRAPWERITVDEAFERHAGRRIDPADEAQFFQVWAEEVQPALGREAPVVVVAWPASMASLAKLDADGTADRFEAFFRGVELCNGFGELTDAEEQRLRFERDQDDRGARGLPVYPIDRRFLEALEGGMPESGGNALGVDRLLMLLTGADSLQAVMPFPADDL
jgi:lysyl-tRNA synthetase class 2